MGDRCFGCKSAAGFMVHKVHFSEKLRVTWVEMFKDTLENELVKAQKTASERERMLLFFPTTRTSFFKGHLSSKRCEICMLYSALFLRGDNFVLHPASQDIPVSILNVSFNWLVVFIWE